MFHKILVAMDTSAIGKRVFDEALALAKPTKSSLMLLHVLSTKEQGSPNMPTFSSVEYYPLSEWQNPGNISRAVGDV